MKIDWFLAEQMFYRCLNAKYIHVDECGGDYAIEEDSSGETLYLLFQWSHGTEDWKSNFNFPARPYKDMKLKWYCHRGFLRVWKGIEDRILPHVLNQKYKKIIVVGYSHGAAIATFAHEFVWFHRPDLRDGNNIEGYGFGCPRVMFGFATKKLLKRWENFHPIRNLNDIVTHVPPVLFGFRHVNKVIKIGTKIHYKDERHPKRRKCVLAHYPQNYIFSLYQKYKDQSK